MELAFHQGRVFVGMRDRIACLDYKTGALVGQVPLPKSVRRPTFLLEGEHLYVMAPDHVLCFTHAGQFVWQSPHGLSLNRDGATMGIPGNVRAGDAIGA
jgi:hypothetical protein